MNPDSLGICTWLLDRFDPVRALRHMSGFPEARRAQVGFFGRETLAAARAVAIRAVAADAGIHLCGTFVAFDGEDYASIATIAATGGLVPDDRFGERADLIRRAAHLTADLGCETLAIHAGRIPADPDAPDHAKLLQRVEAVADALEEFDVRLLLETGAESADTLATFLDAVGRDNVAVNFDTGNFVLYGTDEPAQAAARLAGRIACVHLKDAVGAPSAGIDFGRVVPLGAGEASIPRVINKLRARGYTGPLLLEKTGDGSDAAVRNALAYVVSLVG